MPSQKRARKRAARQARLAAVEKRQRRRSALRRTAVVVVLAAAGVGIYLAVKPSGKTKATTTTSTTATAIPAGFTAAASTSTTTVADETTSANCPTPFTATTALHKPSFTSPPPMIIDTSKSYDAKITTDVGSFVISLDVSAAPKTVNNFVFLAENHFYDCVVFHRVIPGFMDQTGDPTGTGTGGPGYQFDNENIPSGLSYATGEVAMANSGPNTNGSQFFVLVAPYTAPSSGANPGYSLFGSVVSGQSVVNNINDDGSSTGTPNKLHRMISVVILES